MSSAICHHCGCSEIDIDPARGDSVCTNCGSVLEDNLIVSEVQFEETSGGGATAIGQFVSSDGKAPSLSRGFHHGISKESRAITLQNGRQKINHVGQQLRLNQHCMDTAFNFFKMAVSRRLTRGRKNSHVVAACLYMVCRVEGTPHMLLDFSDIVQVNVYELGRTYLRLSQELRINIPPTDPCHQIIRFAHKLEFGDKTHEVSMTALRMVQRMKRDWIHTGRRPSGLCGAALLVAARLHDFNRTTKDLIKVVKVCEATLRKRLNEFGDTPSSGLTLDEFMSIDLEEEQDPPAFKQARKKAKLQQLEDKIPTEAVEKEITDLEREIEEVLEKRREKLLRGPYAKFAQETDTESVADEESTVTAEFVTQETVESIQEFLDDRDVTKSSEQGEGTAPTSPVATISQNTEQAAEAEATVVAVIQDATRANATSEGGRGIPDFQGSPTKRGLGPTSFSLGLKSTIAECMSITATPDVPEESGELDLTGIDDKELDYYIMTAVEVSRKTTLWNTVNADYLQEMKEKEEKAAQEKEDGVTKPEKKKRRVTKKKSNTPANTAGEAIEKMLQEKRISNKINYDVLRNLNSQMDGKGDDAGTPSSTPGTPLTPRKPSLTPLASMPLAQRLGPSIFGFSLGESSSSTRPGRLSSMLSSGADSLRPSKKVKFEEEPKGQVQSTRDSNVVEIVVETEPIQYHDDDADADQEYDEEGHISAAQLFGRGEDEDYDDYADDDFS